MKRFKKYPDRRLYDIENKRFTNLRSIIALIRAGEAVEIRCSKAGTDCTRSVLMSAFLSLSESHDILSAPLLYRLIRSTGPGVYNRRLAQRITISLERLMTEVDDLDTFYAQLKGDTSDT